MLVQERPEHEVEVIMKDLDSDFVDKIFRTTLLQCMPPAARRLMLPHGVDRQVSTQPDEVVFEAGFAPLDLGKTNPSTEMASSTLQPLTRTAASTLPDGAGLELTPSLIVDLIRDRCEKRTQAITEPALLPAIVNLKVMSAALTWKAMTLTATKASAIVGSLSLGASLLCPLLAARLPRATPALGAGRGEGAAPLAILGSTGAALRGLGIAGLVCAAGSAVVSSLLAFSPGGRLARTEHRRDRVRDRDRNPHVGEAAARGPADEPDCR